MDICNYKALLSDISEKDIIGIKALIKSDIRSGWSNEVILRSLHKLGWVLNTKEECDVLKSIITNINKEVKENNWNTNIKNNFFKRLQSFNNELESLMNIPSTSTSDVEEIHELSQTKQVQTPIPNFSDMYIGLRNLQKNVEDGFVREILVRSLVNFNTGVRITKLSEIQNEIADYKNLLFSRIASFLNTEVDDMYDLSTGNLNTEDYSKVMEMARNRFSDMETLQESLAEEFNNQENIELLNAYNSYALLANFDEVLLNQQGDRFTIDDKLIGKEGRIDKYQLKQKSNVQKGWSDSEDVDSTSGQGSTTRALLATIPLLDSNGKNILHNYVDPGSLLSVFDNIKSPRFVSELANNEYKYLVYTLNENPITNLKKMLEILMNNKYKLSSTALNIINSFYDRFFSPTSSESTKYSLERIMNNWMSSSNAITTYSLLDGVIGSLTRSSQASYIRYEQTNNGLISKDIKKSTESGESTKLRNNLLGHFKVLRENLAKNISILNKYGNKLEIQLNGIRNKNGESFVLSYTTISDLERLLAKEVPIEDTGRFAIYEKTQESSVLGQVLRCMDDILNTSFSRSGTYIWNKYINTFGKTGFEDALKATIAAYRNIQSDDIFDNKLITKNMESFIGKLTSVNINLDGVEFKTTVKNLEGNNLPNSIISNLATTMQEHAFRTIYDSKIGGKDPLYESNIYGYNDTVDAIHNISVRADVLNSDGKVKIAKKLSASELIYMSIVEDFYGRDAQGKNKYIKIQPATYSDKTRSFMITVDTDKLLLSSPNGFWKANLMEENYKSNRGFYINSFSRVLEQYNILFPDLHIDPSKYNNFNAYVKSINAKLSTIQESELRKLFNRKHINIAEGIIYSKNKGKLTLNFNLAYKASVLYNSLDVSDAYKEFIKKQRVKFIENLISFEVRLWKENTGNLQTKLVELTREKSQDWIDSSTDEFILAKDHGKDITADYEGNISEDVILNPLLEKYLHGYDLLASNARLLLTGPSYAHPNKKGNNNWSLQDFIYDESVRALANSKRNVSIPGSIQYFTQESLFGVRPTYKIAVVKDYQAPVYNIQGVKDSIDAHDGAVYTNPITSIIESYALQDSATGINKKPLVADLDPTFGGGLLIKCDTYGIDNNLMRMSSNSDINMESLFKRMCNPILSDFDLTKNLFKKELSLNDILNGRRLFFQKGIHTYEIQNIGRNEDKTYSRTLVEVEPHTGKVINGNAIIDGPVSITSIYDLWKFLGGERSKSIGKSGTPEYSNISLEATTNYCLNVGQYIGNGEYPTQKNTTQPLRDTLIDYLACNSAVKVGAANINSTDVLVNSTIPLNTMTIRTQDNGIQQDLDHSADESTMTEYSQVLSSIAANGWTTDLAKLAYQDLGKATLALIKDYDTAVKEYLKTYNKSKLYDLIAKDVVDKISKNKEDAGISQSIIDVINQELKKFRKDKSITKTHSEDSFKMPFSDSNLFANTLVALTSPINSSVIKKQRHGIGCVMNPSYGVIQLYRIKNQTFSYDDIYIMAARQGQTVEQFLSNKQNEEPEQEAYNLLPGDRIIYTDSNNTIHNVYINTIDLYRSTKSYLQNNNINFKIDVTKPSDLRPQRIYWNILVDRKKVRMNVYDLPSVINNVKWLESNDYKKLKSDKSKYNELKQINLRYVKDIQDDMVSLTKGYITTENGNTEIYDLVNEDVESVIPSIYASTFNLHPDDSIYSVLDPERDFFYKKQREIYDSTKILGDLAFIIANGTIKYITFTEPTNLPIVGDEKTIIENGITYALDKNGNKIYTIHDGNGSIITKYAINTGNEYTELYYCSDPKRAAELYGAFGYTEYIKPFTDHAKIKETIEAIANSKKSNNYIELLSQTNDYDKVNREFIRKKSNEIKTSFLKSLEFVGARIPSQTFQSFLKTKCISLLKTSNNVVYISPWAQWLEGADFDADKMYLMGYDFNDNGKFMGWSPLFNYNDIELLHISERLPFPTGKSTEFIASDTNTNVDITPELSKYILEETNKSENYTKNQLNNIIDIILKIGDNSEVTYNLNKLTGSESIIKKIQDNVNEHNLFKMKYWDVSKYLNNSSSSRIGQIISNPKNYMAANVPVSLGEVRDAADNSITGQSSKEIVMENPTSIFRMFEENMEGKDVIAIAATAEKIFFALTQYYNQGVRSNDEEWKKCMDFFRQFKLNNKVPTNVFNLANVNTNDIQFTQRVKEIMQNQNLPIESVKNGEFEKLTPDQSLVISCLLSAATDNAKELILSKINCNTKLAGVYTYLIMLGIDFQDITKFMTSAPIQMISNLLKNNIFNPYRESLNVKNAIKMVLEGPPISNYISYKNLNTFAKQYLSQDKSKLSEIRELLVDKINKKQELTIENPEINPPQSINIQFVRFTRAFNKIIQEIKNIDQDKNSYFRNTIEEFSKIYNLSDEATSLGRSYLSSNQGFPTDMTGKLKFYSNIAKSVSDREAFYNYSSKENFINSVISDKPYLKIGKDENGNTQYSNEIKEIQNIWPFINSVWKNGFDFHKFLLDPIYNQNMIKYYNLIKGTFNILDVINRLPHFKSYLDVSEIIYNVDSTISDKYKLIEALYKKFYKNNFVNDDQINNLISYINRYLISNYLDSVDFKFTIKAGENAFINNKLKTVLDDTVYGLDTNDGRATFKYWMEKSVIPTLKSGMTLDSHLNIVPANKIVTENKFIDDIKIDNDKNKDKFNYDFYRCSIDLSSTNSRVQQKVNELSISLNDLFGVNYIKGNNSTNIGNLFVLYNLIVNQNRYGANKLTSILGMSVTNNNPNSILNQYLKSVGNNDFNQSLSNNFEIIGDDAEKVLAPIVKESKLKNISGNYARVYDMDNRVYRLMKKVDGDWEDAISTDIDTLKTYNNYYTLNRPNVRNIFWGISQTNKNQDKDLITLKNLIALGQLNITVKCK